MCNKYHGFWSKWTIAILAAGLLFLIAGGFPYMGTPGIYHNGLFLLLGLILGILTLFASFKLRWKKPSLLLLHLGSLLLITGAYIDFSSEQKVTFRIYVGDEYMSEVVLDERSDVPIPLGFGFVIRDFKVEKYPPTYSLYDTQTRTKIEDGQDKNGTITFPKRKLSIEADRFVSEFQGHTPFIPMNDGLVAVQNRPADKYYGSAFRITDAGQTYDYELAVNHPVTYKGWRFYLISHGEVQDRKYVHLIARHAPGRLWAITGMYVLMAGAFWFGFSDRKGGKTA